MISIIEGLPDYILGISAEGQVTGNDYETVLILALEEKLKAHKKIRLLYQFGSDFTGFDLTDIGDDTGVGIKHFAAWEKVALVSDNHQVNIIAKFFSFMFPCEVRIYNNAEMDEAKKWIRSDVPEHTSWIKDEMKKINSEFPLSGGETNQDFEQVVGSH
jgi:hypothetical protein